MMKRVLGLIFVLAISTQAHAVTLMDANEWKVMMSGFIETDVISDTTRSFNEVIGNGAVAKNGTLNGENGRMAFSDRNSRLAFAVIAPTQDDWKTKGYFEFDFLGYEPNPQDGSNSNNSEAGFYSNPAIRIRHANMTAERDGWSWLVGQSWSLFGWQPNYVLTTASVAPGPGILYQRNLQITFMKAFEMGDNTLQAAISAARPTQRDSGTPNVDVGVRYALGGWRSGLAGATGDAKAEAASIGLSGTFRQFSTAGTDSTSNPSMNKTNSSAFAADILIPIIPASDKDVSNTLTLTAEYSAGTGYGDELPNNGVVGAMGSSVSGVTAGSQKANTNLDSGLGAFVGTDFNLLKLDTLSTQLQFHFAKESHMFATLGYSQTHSSNAQDLGGSYDKTQMQYINLFRDLTTQWRVALEWEKIQTHYVDGSTPNDNRYQASAYFRF